MYQKSTHSGHPYQAAVKDICSGFTSWRIWTLLAWQEIQLRYRRSYLGPFWITINMAILIYAIGFLYGRLFKIELTEYYPALASGMIIWNFIASIITESTNTFIGAENYIKQIKLPYSIYLLKMIDRNLIIFLHNITVMLPIILIFNIPVGWPMLLILPSMLLLSMIAFVYGGLLAIIGSRFRDLAQIISSLTQIVFFLTPIMWSPASLPPQYAHYILLNPFAQFIELVRNPMLGKFPSLFSITSSLILLFLGSFITFFIFMKKRKLIVYWL